jgi:glycosyltransferase EpsE
MPQISVLLPVHKANPAQLALSMASVMLSESDDLELVVGLDGSAEPDLLDVLETIMASGAVPVRVLALPRRGLVGTLNALIDASDSRYIARQDADDFSLPLRFTRQQQALAGDPSSSFCGTQICRCDPQLHAYRHQRRYPISLRAQLAYAALLNNPIAHPSLMLRRSALKELRYSHVPGAEDWQLYVELWQRGARSFNLGSTELLYRTHPNQITARQRDGAILQRLQRDSLAAARSLGLAGGLELPHRLCQKLRLSERLLRLRWRWRQGLAQTR